MNTSAEYTAIINLIYPVGSIYYAIDEGMDPTNWIPGTTWKSVVKSSEEISEKYGSYLVNRSKVPSDIIDPQSEDNSDTSRTFTLGESKGNEKVTLSLSQLPEHIHKKSYHSKDSFYEHPAFDELSTSVRYVDQEGLGPVYTDLVGGNKPHNNIPPSVLIYAWERTG